MTLFVKLWSMTKLSDTLNLESEIFKYIHINFTNEQAKFFTSTALNDINNHRENNKYRRLSNIFLQEDLYIDRNHELAILELDHPFATDFISPLGYIDNEEQDTSLGKISFSRFKEFESKSFDNFNGS